MTATSAARRSRGGTPLSIRLAMLLSLAVVAVLLVTGLAVNRFVSRSLEEQLTTSQRSQIELLASQLQGADLSQPGSRRAVDMAFRRIARPIDGRIELIAADGTLLAARGNVRGGIGTERIEEPVPGDAGWTLIVEFPSGQRPFLSVFNATLLVAGIAAVVALMLAATLLSDRLTRPLRAVAAAANRLGSGDLSARAEGGTDRESTELAEAFNAMAERLERSEGLRRRAASDIAHDLATPATVLESQLQAMVDGVVPMDRTELDRARASAAALSGVVGQLRDLVDVEAAPLHRRASVISLDDLLAEAADALEPLYREASVQLELAPAPEGLHVEVDSSQMGRVLRNVLTNAAQHSPPGARVRVEAGAEGNAVILRVSDQGRGIATEDVPHVFERFYRADPARSGGGDSRGSGIGLTVARELVRANGGEVWVERTDPHGTTFAISLPLAG
ncbi:MAG TPA: HAMP domain-containing sensor histidine kinase [Candidatus Limnocylindria bacterium]|nr:HAMP domain-containing sensor histidine kinase [Candidatus Limnocylindria bacterium]